ncbi:MAG: oligosaccharide flippase family protein [Kiritimatiellae bacterium]|nr:oligosaccharide flippase family protein [Kiritimatiellia bacterium]
MKLDFARNTKRNMVANALNSGIRLVFPFLNRTLFLWLLGPAYLGLNGLFGSLLGVLVLAELGFGQAVVCSMYKPVADDDRELLCAYLKFYRMVYRCVGTTIFAIGLCLLPFLGRLVHGSVPPDIELHVLYVIHLVNTAASYFLFAYRGVVLGAHHRNDVITNIRTAVSVIQYVAVFLILLLTRNYYLYIISTVLFTVIQNILLVTASRRLFPDIEPRGTLDPALRRRVILDVKSIFMHKVGGVITNSTDNLIISSFLGLVAVAAYGNYYYVVTSVAGLVAVVYSSMTGGFGNKIYTESKEENFRLFMRMNRLAMVVVVFCSAMMAALYQPFMKVWVKGDPALMRHALTPTLMVFYFYIMQSRQVLLAFKSAAALWKQDRWKPIVAGVVNLGLNILFVLFLPDDYKLDGVIFSTIVGFAFIQIPWESHVVFSSFFGKKESRAYWRAYFGFAACALALCAVAYWSARIVPIDGLAGLALKGAASFATVAVLLFALFRRDVSMLLRNRKTAFAEERRS